MPSVLSAQDIADLRALTVSFFPDTCTITTVAQVSDGRGGTTAQTTVSGDTPCKLRTTGYSPTERVYADRITSGTAYSIDLPYGTAVSATSTIQIGARKFTAIGVVKGGAEAMQQTAVCSERG